MNIKAIASWVGLWFAGVLMMGLVLFVGLGVYGELASVQEDDATFNCWTMGNMTCGPDAPLHGFVNNFQHR